MSFVIKTTTTTRTGVVYVPSKHLHRRHKSILHLQVLEDGENYETSEEEDETANEDIEAILEEEFFEEEEEEPEEEQEIDAVERMQNEIVERFDSERESIEGVQVPIPLCILLHYMILK